MAAACFNGLVSGWLLVGGRFGSIFSLAASVSPLTSNVALIPARSESLCLGRTIVRVYACFRFYFCLLTPTIYSYVHPASACLPLSYRWPCPCFPLLSVLAKFAVMPTCFCLTLDPLYWPLLPGICVPFGFSTFYASALRSVIIQLSSGLCLHLILLFNSCFPFFVFASAWFCLYLSV